MLATSLHRPKGALLVLGCCLGMLAMPAMPAPAESQAAMGFAPGPFLRGQLATPRVLAAADRSEERARDAFREAGVAFPATDLYLRAFKHEGVLELWARNPGERRYRLVQTYPMCATSGTLGPKVELGDRQIPEGIYTVDGFNPFSSYHLSMRVDYPNRRDLARGASRPGGDIFIHGGCATVGCIPLDDGPVEELYWVLARARDLHAPPVPLHIFPARMSGEGARVLRSMAEDRSDLAAFWAELRPAYDFFEAAREVPPIQIGRRYVLDESPAPASPAGPLGRPIEE
jgi:murein L,D-transpeptidase YafK